METQDGYEAWLRTLRQGEECSTLTDRVMEQVMEDRPRLVASKTFRIAVSVAALAVGLARFVYLAVIADLVPL